MKVAIVTCSPRNDYPRALSLRAAFAACSDVDLQVIRNSHRGWLRYFEVALKLGTARVFLRPDVYVVTFRGYEVFLFMVLTLIRKPVVFDELINFTEWMEENGRLKHDSLPYKLFRRWYAWLARRSAVILADTDAHAKYSATLNMLRVDRYKTIPVCAEENTFQPVKGMSLKKEPFTVLYYGHMVPLHGLEYVLQAAVLLKGEENVRFRLVGGKKTGKVAKACAEAAKAGAHVTHESWLPFAALPEAIHSAGLVLGGPFGDTLQAGFVITGKTYQALACGAPVLIGKNQVGEGFTDKENCLMVPQADAKALAYAVMWAAGHSKELTNIGRAGRELYGTHFSQKTVNKLVEEIVEELRWI